MVAVPNMRLQICLSSALALLIIAPASAVTQRTIAVSGYPAPGQDGAVFSSLSSPTINDTGEVSIASLAYKSETGFRGVLWSEGAGNGLAAIARAGDAAPGTGANVTFSEFTESYVNSSGNVAFYATLAGDGVTTANNRGLWVQNTDGTISLVARTGDTVPGVNPDQKFATLVQSCFNSSGQIVMAAQMSADGSSPGISGLWTTVGGNGLQLISQQNVHPTGLPIDHVIDSFGPLVLNSAGQYAVNTQTHSVGTPNSYSHSIWRGTNANDMSLIAYEGQQAPGYANGVTLRALGSNPTINRTGHITFYSILGGLPPGSDTVAIWSDRGGNGFQPVLKPGDLVPAAGPGVSFWSFNEYLTMNESDRLGFIGLMRGTGVDSSNDRGVFHELADGQIRMVAREGSIAPGTNAKFNVLDIPDFNGSDQIAFLSSLSGTGVTSSNDSGLWAEDPSGQLHLIAREGDVMDVDDGPGVDLRTISSIRLNWQSGDELGRPGPYNDRGQVAYWVQFTNFTTGVFVSNVAAGSLAGDYTGNGAVDEADYVAWRRQAGTTGSNLAADGNRDGVVDVKDYYVWKMHFNENIPSASGLSTAVPECSAIVLLTLGLCLAAVRPPCGRSRARQV